MTDENKQDRRVELESYNQEWPILYADEAKKLATILKLDISKLHHIGSTAIPDMCAKPVIDILAIVDNINNVDALNAEFEKLGYVCMGEYGIKGRRFYWKSHNKRTHHVHIFQKDNAEIARHLAFKDFLIESPDHAHAYSVIRQHLAHVFPTDIESYTHAKQSFIQYIDYKTGNAPEKQLNAQDDIILAPHNPAWKALAKAEINAITEIVGSRWIDCIEHLGSTAVNGLLAKPILDIFIGVSAIKHAKDYIKPLETLGYVDWPDNPDPSHVRLFKGMPPFGKRRTHHLHIVESNSETLKHRVMFRDILSNNPDVRLNYASLKTALSTENKSDREAYTDKKADFIKSTLAAHGYRGDLNR